MIVADIDTGVMTVADTDTHKKGRYYRYQYGYYQHISNRNIYIIRIAFDQRLTNREGVIDNLI